MQHACVRATLDLPQSSTCTSAGMGMCIACILRGAVRTCSGVENGQRLAEDSATVRPVPWRKRLEQVVK